MSRKNENKPAYSKPCIELITMEVEGSLLLTASDQKVAVTGGARNPNSFGESNSQTFKRR